MHAVLQAHRAYGYVLTLLLLFFVTVEAAAQDVDQLSVEELEGRAAALFGRSCARVGCHAAPFPQQGLDLRSDLFYAPIVYEPSQERP